MNDNIYKLYIQQKEEIADIVAKTGQLLPAFQKAYKEGRIGLFQDFIHENNLQEAFVQNSFDDLIKLLDSADEEKQCFTKIAEKEGLSYLNKIYGNEFGNKLQSLYEAGKAQLYDMYTIANINQRNDIQKQGIIMTKILDLYSNDNLKIGIHRTGTHRIGKTLNQEGLNLTGHLSSGVVPQEKEDIMSRLENNISFDYGAGELLSQIAIGGNYKNYLNEKFIDISIIAIPKNEIENRKQALMVKGNVSDRLNPKFIKGYITVDSENNTMENYVENPRYLSNENAMTIYKKQNRFLSWIKEKFYNIKDRFSESNSNAENIDHQDQRNNRKNRFVDSVTQNGELRNGEQQRKQIEIAKKWEKQNESEVGQDNNDRNL